MVERGGVNPIPENLLNLVDELKEKGPEQDAKLLERLSSSFGEEVGVESLGELFKRGDELKVVRGIVRRLNVKLKDYEIREEFAYRAARVDEDYEYTPVNSEEVSSALNALITSNANWQWPRRVLQVTQGAEDKSFSVSQLEKIYNTPRTIVSVGISSVNDGLRTSGLDIRYVESRTFRLESK